MRRIAMLLVVASACAGSPPPPPAPAPSPTQPPPTAPAPTPLSTSECEAMVMHITELAVAEQGSATDADRATARAQLEPYVAECASLDRAVHRCVMAATDLAAVPACEGQSANAK